MPTEIIPLGGSIQRSDVTTPIEEIQNFVPVLVTPTMGSKKQIRMAKRRGYQNRLVAAASGFSIKAGMQWIGTLGTGTAPSTKRGYIVYAAGDGTNIKLYQWDTSETTLGTFAAATYLVIDIQETRISGVANLTLNIGNSSTGQKALFFPVGGALTEITDAQFPTTSIGRFVHMDGYAFIASTDGSIYWSDLNSLSSWTAGNSIAVQMQPDSLVGLAKMRNIVVALGTGSIEFFQRTQLTNPVLQRIPHTALRIGCLNGSSMQEVGESLVVISNSTEGAGVHIIEAVGQAKKISTPFMDKIIGSSIVAGASGPLAGTVLFSPAMMGVVQQHGSVGVVLQSDQGVKYIYWPAVDLWSRHLMASPAETTGQKMWGAGGAQFTTDGSYNVVWSDDTLATATSGNDYNATAFTAYIQTVPMTHGTARKKYYTEARLIGDQQTVTTPVILSYSDDNGANFTTAGTFEMSTNPIISITRMGSSRKRVWKLSNTSAGGCVIDALEITYDFGTN